MIGPDIAAALVQSVVDALPLAHDIGYPHQDPTSSGGGGDGGTSPVVIGGAATATLALAGGLIWVRERSRKADESAGLEGHADADRDQKGPRTALEPGDHARPGEEPA